MPLIVGLGNPGKEYAHTRHNAGFMAVDALALQLGASWKDDKPARAQVAETNVDGQKLILVKPQTFMNLSGESVAVLYGRFHLHPHQVWVVYDEVSIELGTIRLRQGGSAGGHNGIKSIIQHIGEDFWRIRIGVGAPATHVPLEDYVLQRFNSDEQRVITNCTKAVNDLIVRALHQPMQETTLRMAL